MSNVVEHAVPTVTAPELALVLEDGSTLYKLTVTAADGPVTVYLSHRENQDLMADVGAVIAAFDDGTSYAGSVRTMAGVNHHKQPSGLIRTVLEPAGGETVNVIVDDGAGGRGRAYVDKAGAEQLLIGTALMAGHLEHAPGLCHET